ncbi:MAG: YihY/virulence factor BrkB family protein [Magnetococcales bacterium]|nr:YihY/virulence factor BrkB family protein [Magnetococcales bacterium]
MEIQQNILGSLLLPLVGLFSLSNFKNWLWQPDVMLMPAWQRWINLTIRVCYRVMMDLSKKRLTMQATSLVYTTLLSLVPLLAVSFSTLKAFGVHNQIDPILADFLTPLGPQGDVIRLRILEFVENINASVLGSMGLLLLFYTVISLIQKIEESFNDIWFVKHNRHFSQKLSQYLSVIVVGPVLIFSAIGLTASIENNAFMQQIMAIEPFGSLIVLTAKMLPYVLVIIAFTFFYMIVPNTHVKWGCAIIGGLISGVIWETTSWFFAAFVAGSVNYVAVYSVFATLIIFMIWLQLNWLIILIGSNITFYCQNVGYLTIDGGAFRLSNRVKERLALIVLVKVGHNAYLTRPPLTMAELVLAINSPAETLGEIVEILCNHNLLAKLDQDGAIPVFIPNRPFDITFVRDVISDVRNAEDSRYHLDDRIVSTSGVKRIFGQIDDAVNDSIGKKTLKDLVLEEIKEQKKNSEAVSKKSL